MEVWIVGDSRGAPPSFTEEASTLAGDQRIGRVDLAGALNETLSFRFAVRASAALVAPDICVAPLRSVDSRIDASAITVFRVHPVSIRDWPGWHLRYVNPNARNANPLDVLVPVRAPRDGLPAVMLPSETYHFWVDIVVPKGTDAGLFTTTIKLTSAGVFVGGVTVRLTVWPFLLPDAAGVPIIAELDHRKLFRHHVRYRGRPHGVGVDDWRDDPLRSELDALLASTLRMLRQNRLTPVLPELNPIVKVTAHDSVVVDWGQYDAVVEPCFDGRAFFSRVAIPVWPLPLGGVRPPHPADAAARQYKSDLMQAYVGQCAAHFARNDWLDRTYAVAPPRSWLDPKAAKITRGFASMLAGTNVRTASRLFPQDLAPYGWTDFTYTDMSEAVDIWMSPAQFFSKARMAAEREAGRRTWVAVDRPPFSGSVSIHASPSDVRVLSWQAEELAAQALHIGSVNDWPDADDSPSPQDCVDRDPRVLIYPGGPFGLDHPVPSARLMYLRRTAQDDAYFRLLREHGLGHLVATLVGSLCPYAGADAYRTHFADGRTVGWPDDVGLFDDARRIMANELIRVANDVCHDEPRKQFVRGAEWRRLMMRTRQLKVRVDGTRVRAIGTRTAPGFEIECALTITNSSRVPVSGSVRFTELPSGWESSGEHPIRRLAPGDSLRVKLFAHATAVPIHPSGTLSVPFELATDDGLLRRFETRVAWACALPRKTPINVDGDLSDWPLGSANVMSNFLLISGAGRGVAPGASVTPRRSTIGFVLKDEENLYIALNCECAPQLIPAASRQNHVFYEDMIPKAGELLEVLIDPTNGGTRSPADLYHIALMYSGADVIEKGMRFDPPCGRSEPWPVDIEVATRTTQGRWTAELRVPLVAFAPGATDHAVWGFNITRFDGLSKEFSTWSGALHNAYDPLSLGNLFLP